MPDVLTTFVLLSAAALLGFVVSLFWARQRWLRRTALGILVVGAGVVLALSVNPTMPRLAYSDPDEAAFPQTDEALVRVQEATAAAVEAALRTEALDDEVRRLQVEAMRVEAERQFILNRGRAPDAPIGVPQLGLTAAERAALDRLNAEVAALQAATAQATRTAAAAILQAEAARTAPGYFAGKAEIAHNAPGQMVYRQEQAVELVLVPESLGIPAREVLGDTATPVEVVAGIDYAVRMQATLEGSAFEIRPPGPLRQRIPGERSLKWHWTVMPISFGRDKQLVFRLEAIHQDGEAYEVIATETYRAVVHVDVGWFDWVEAQVARLGTLGAAAAATVTLLIAIAGFYFTHLRTKAKPPPTEIVIVNPPATDPEGPRT